MMRFKESNLEERLKSGTAEGVSRMLDKPRILPISSAARKEIPLATGVLDYFPAALAEVAKVSFEGNKQHNPGEPLHWAREKSTDQADTIIRHFLERGKRDSDGQLHSAKLAWRALALLQLELEAMGAPMARGATAGPKYAGQVGFDPPTPISSLGQNEASQYNPPKPYPGESPSPRGLENPLGQTYR